MKKTSPVVPVVGAVVVLLAAVGLGLGVKKVRSWRGEAEPKGQAKPAAEQIEIKAEGAVVEPVEEAHIVAQEPAEQAEAEPEENAKEDANGLAKVESIGGPGVMAGGLPDWRQIWADLNLTEEEMARLRQGFALAWQKWQNMSEEEREAEMGRLRGMRQRWENMSDEERREASQRMRDRFEEWRESGRVELPELSLD